MLTKDNFSELLAQGPCLLDGATGSYLRAKGMPRDCATEEWVLRNPEVLVELQRGYAKAGSKIIYAPTFQAQPIALRKIGLENHTEAINAQLIALSRSAAPGCLIAGDIATLAAFCDSWDTDNFDLLVENYPIVAVEEIKQAGEIIDPGLYDITVRGNAGVIYKDDGWTYYGFPHGLTGDAMTGSRNITVRYTAGYILPWEATDEAPTDLPADLEGLAQEMVQYIFGKLESGGSSGLKAFSISDVRWEWSDETPSSWQDIINQYKRVWL